MRLSGNNISDLSPLAENQGLGNGTEIDVRENPLSYPSIHTHIPSLEDRGVKVHFDNRTPTTLEPISGDNQEGLPGKALSDPFIVEVKDESGSVFQGVPVTFAVTAGGGTLANRTTTDRFKRQSEGHTHTWGQSGDEYRPGKCEDDIGTCDLQRRRYSSARSTFDNLWQ